MVAYFTWILTATTLVGAYYNIKKNTTGFYIWFLTDIAWIAVNLHYKIYAQSFLFAIFAGLAIYGIYEWKDKERDKT